MTSRRHPAVASSLAFLSTLAIGVSAGASVLHVRADALPGGDGLSWATAMNDLQAALAAATPRSGVNQVWVAEGNYTPSSSDATVSFALRNGLALYGGFAGSETSLGQRDIDSHPTVLNGDIGGDDIVGAGAFWYTTWNINSANSGHIVTANGTDATAILDGFIVANGSTGPAGTPAGSELMFGGGLYAVDASPTIRNCTFTHCLAAFAAGGAMYLWNSNAVVTDCHFVENYGHFADGGAVYVGGASQPVIRDSSFETNIVVGEQPDIEGAGMAVWSTQPVEIRRCDFIGNTAKTFYGASPAPAYGGGLFNFNQPITVGECRFIDNTARIGGGMASFGKSTIVNCLFLENDAVTEFSGQGAAAWLWGNPGIDSTIVNCTIASNHGKEYAVHGAYLGKVHLRNSIVWANTGSNPDLVGGYLIQVGGKFDASYCCIKNIFGPSAPGEDSIDPADLPGCTQADPKFVSAADPHLAPNSPCIDSGNTPFVPAGVTVDLDGYERVVDDPRAANIGVGTPPVDMGCYEYGAAPPCVAADLDCSGSVDAADLAILLASWGTPGAADLNQSGAVDAADLAMLLAAWG
jgi:hypothetical protein